MAWNNYNNRRNDGGYNNRGYDRDYRDDGYNNYEDRPRKNFKFSVGQKCFLKDFPDTTVSIIRIGREQYECRLPDLKTRWFYEHELEAIEMKSK